MEKRKPLSYIADLLYGATKYPNGLLKPKVVKGYFSDNQFGKLQKIFFNELLLCGFKRTYWQIVFPGQIASLVKDVTDDHNGINEYHTRFYDDGTIDCEIEVGRFNSNHWVGPRNNGIKFLKEILEQMTSVPPETKGGIQKLFGVKGYSHKCSRVHISSTD